MSSRLHLYHSLVVHFQAQCPTMRITQVRGLSLLVLGVVVARHVSLGRMAQALPLAAHPASTERRLRRVLANPRLPTARVWSLVRRQVLTDLGPWRFVLDLTPVNAETQVVCLGVVVGRRVLPLAVRAVPLRTRWPVPLRTLWAAMVAEVAADVPSGAQVTVIADRGLLGPGIVRPCTNAGWAVVIRCKATDTSRVRRADGSEIALQTLVEQTQRRWSGPVALFKQAGWIGGWLTIWPTLGHADPWVLFSTQPGGAKRVTDYRCRMRIEATFQDLKSRGFHLDGSRVRAGERIERLWVVLSLAGWWLWQVGNRVVRSGQRPRFDQRNRCTLSRGQLGWLRLQQWWLAPGPQLPRLPLGRWHPPPVPLRPVGLASRAHQHCRTHDRPVRTQSVRM